MIDGVLLCFVRLMRTYTNKSDAEDVLQDTFLQYMQHFSGTGITGARKGVAAAGCHQPEQKQAEFGVVQAHGHTQGKLSVR